MLTSLLDFYAKWILNRKNVTFGAMMSGFIQNGYIKDAVNLFCQMQDANSEPEAEIYSWCIYPTGSSVID